MLIILVDLPFVLSVKCLNLLMNLQYYLNSQLTASRLQKILFLKEIPKSINNLNLNQLMN